MAAHSAVPQHDARSRLTSGRPQRLALDSRVPHGERERHSAPPRPVAPPRPPSPQPRPSLAAGGGAAARRPFCGAARSVALGSARSGARGRCSAVLNPFSRTDPSVRARRRPGGPGPRRPPARSALRARGEVRGGRPGGRGCTRPRAQRGARSGRRSLWPRRGWGGRAAPPPTAFRRGPRSRASSWGSSAGPARSGPALAPRGCGRGAAGGARPVGRRRGRLRWRRGPGPAGFRGLGGRSGANAPRVAGKEGSAAGGADTAPRGFPPTP